MESRHRRHASLESGSPPPSQRIAGAGAGGRIVDHDEARQLSIGVLPILAPKPFIEAQISISVPSTDVLEKGQGVGSLASRT
jgi:hypothetical protein